MQDTVGEGNWKNTGFLVTLKPDHEKGRRPRGRQEPLRIAEVLLVTYPHEQDSSCTEESDMGVTHLTGVSQVLETAVEGRNSYGDIKESV